MNADLDVIILAGGSGSRLSKITSMPKCFVKIGEVSIMAGNISELIAVGRVARIFVNCREEDRNLFTRELSGYESVEIVLVPEDRRLGTAGTVLQIEKQNSLRDYFVVYGDQLYLGSAGEFIVANADIERNVIGFVNASSGQARHSGVIEVDSRERVASFIEKPKEDFGTRPFLSVNVGLYRIRCLRELSDFSEYRVLDFGFDVFPCMIDNEIEICAFEVSRLPISVDTEEKFLAAMATI